MRDLPPAIKTAPPPPFLLRLDAGKGGDGHCLAAKKGPPAAGRRSLGPRPELQPCCMVAVSVAARAQNALKLIVRQVESAALNFCKHGAA
jgi:hypothetical protein